MTLSLFSIVSFLCSFIALFYSSSLGAEARDLNFPTIPISSLITKKLFDTIFLHKDDNACPAKNFYTYDSFIHASKQFPEFGSTGCLDTRKREIAAFLGQISHETTGGWATAPDGPFAWGLCFKEEINPQSNYCDSTNNDWPCFPDKRYFGRGPIQLSWYTFFCLSIIMQHNAIAIYVIYSTRMNRSSNLVELLIINHS